MSRDGQAPRGAAPLLLARDLKRLVWLALLPLLRLAGVMGADSIRRVQAAEDRLVHQAAEQLAGDVDELLRRRRPWPAAGRRWATWSSVRWSAGRWWPSPCRCSGPSGRHGCC